LGWSGNGQTPFYARIGASAYRFGHARLMAIATI
jgi:hypothetical protein